MAAEKTFETSLKELEDIVLQLESEDLPMEKALSLFEKGTELSKTCGKTLDDAEKKIEKLLSQLEVKMQNAAPKA
jgi:exodeoxyribonuclease VII small subunit